jgi:hypothetical protein
MTLLSRLQSAKADFKVIREQSAIDEQAYRDIWAGEIAPYISTAMNGVS